MSDSLFANILSFISVIISLSVFIFYMIDRRHQKFLLQNEYSQQLLDWYSNVMNAIAELECRNDGDSNISGLAKLSVLIDKGRFFFPNIDKEDGFGQDKPLAYQGYRNLTLDFLVALYNIFKNNEQNEYKGKVELLKRCYTSNIFDIIRPKENLEKIKSITNKYFVKNDTFENFIISGNYDLIKHIWD